MTMIWLAIVVRIIANPFSNVFQKLLTRKAVDPLFVIFATHALLSVVCLPVCVRNASTLSPATWCNLAICALLAVGGNTLTVVAMKYSDLSVLGPINAYKAIVSLVPAMVLLHEFPGRVGGFGMILIVAGSWFLVDKQIDEPRRNVFARFFSERGVQYRFAALILSAMEAVFLKRAISVCSPLLVFALWSVLGCCASLAALVALRGNRWVVDMKRSPDHWSIYLLLAISTGLMQVCTLLTFRSFQVGYALALFQTSTLLSVLLGYTVFREKNIVERLIGSLVMVAGRGADCVEPVVKRRSGIWQANPLKVSPFPATI